LILAAILGGSIDFVEIVGEAIDQVIGGQRVSVDQLSSRGFRPASLEREVSRLIQRLHRFPHRRAIHDHGGTSNGIVRDAPPIALAAAPMSGL